MIIRAKTSNGIGIRCDNCGKTRWAGRWLFGGKATLVHQAEQGGWRTLDVDRHACSKACVMALRAQRTP